MLKPDAVKTALGKHWRHVAPIFGFGQHERRDEAAQAERRARVEAGLQRAAVVETIATWTHAERLRLYEIMATIPDAGRIAALYGYPVAAIRCYLANVGSRETALEEMADGRSDEGRPDPSALLHELLRLAVWDALRCPVAGTRKRSRRVDIASTVISGARDQVIALEAWLDAAPPGLKNVLETARAHVAAMREALARTGNAAEPWKKRLREILKAVGITKRDELGAVVAAVEAAAADKAAELVDPKTRRAITTWEAALVACKQYPPKNL